MSVQGVTALVVAIAGVVTAVTALLHSVRTRRQANRQASRNLPPPAK